MTHSIAEHYPFPVEALDLSRPRIPITHDVKWEFRSHDDSGQPCLSENSFQAISTEHARELEALCRADKFKLNVRIVPRMTPYRVVQLCLNLATMAAALGNYDLLSRIVLSIKRRGLSLGGPTP